MANYLNSMAGFFNQKYSKIHVDGTNMSKKTYCGDLEALKVKIVLTIRILEGLKLSKWNVGGK